MWSSVCRIFKDVDLYALHEYTEISASKLVIGQRCGEAIN